jgi:hypothetical protein
MLHATWCTAALLGIAVTPAWTGEPAYAIKTATSAVPKDVKEPIAKLLNDQAVQLLDGKGTVLAELWFRKELPAKATPAQVKNGLTYRELEETTLLGAVRVAQLMTDYRKQKIKPGVYTVRLAFQPMDGDHMGTAPYTEFGLLSPADADAKPDLMSAKELQELSAKAAAGTHPAVFLLFPNNKPEETAKLETKEGGHWVLMIKEPVAVGTDKTAIGIGLNLIGHAAE